MKSLMTVSKSKALCFLMFAGFVGYIYSKSADYVRLRPSLETDEGFLCVQRDGVESLFRLPGFATMGEGPDLVKYISQLVSTFHRHLPNLPCNPLETEVSSIVECFNAGSDYLFATSSGQMQLVEKMTDAAACIGESIVNTHEL